MRGWVCRLQLLLDLTSAVILDGQVPIFISPRNRVVQLYPQMLGSHFVSSYDSQGYGGSIGTCLHARTNSQWTIDFLCSLGTGCIEDTSHNNSSFVASHRYWHWLFKEHCFPFTPFLCVMKLLPCNGPVCRDIPGQHLSLLASQFWLSADMPQHIYTHTHKLKKKLNSVALVRKRTIPTERPLLVGEVSANFCG
jgi:hypothetical protein